MTWLWVAYGVMVVPAFIINVRWLGRHLAETMPLDGGDYFVVIFIGFAFAAMWPIGVPTTYFLTEHGTGPLKRVVDRIVK